MTEGPFELVKVRRQVADLGDKQRHWTVAELYKGSGTTMLRNSFLFAFFAVYMDFGKQVAVSLGQQDLSPFLKGAICANLAWLSIWPLDVVKSQVQSAKASGSIPVLLRDAFRTGILFR